MAPANDNFASATTLSTSLPNSLTSQTTKDATAEAGEPDNWGGSVNQSVWYSFTPSVSGRYKFEILSAVANGGASFRQAFAFFSGTVLTSLTNLRQGAKPTNQTNQNITIDLVAGTTYKLKVYAPELAGTNSRTFDFTLAWELMSVGSPPANDDIANAEDLGTDPSGPYAGNNIAATYEAFEAINGYDQPSTWYRFEVSAASTALVSITKTGSDEYWQPYGEIYKVVNDPPTTFDDTTFQASIGDDTRTPTYVDTNVTFTPGVYYLVVINWNFDGSGDAYDLEFAFAGLPPANDAFTSRVFLPYHYAAQIDGTTDGATTEASEPNTFPGNINPPYPSVWYNYVPPNYQNEPLDIQFDTEGSPTDTYLEVFTGSTIGGLTRIASDHNSGAGGRSKLTINSNGDVNYKIRVSSPPGSGGPFSLHINVKPGGTPPANNDFAGAITLTGYTDSESGTTVGATGEYDDRGHGFAGPTGESTNSVWYKWVPPQTGRILLTVIEATENVYATVWRGTTLAGLVEVQDIVAFGTSGADAVPFQVEGGVTYYFKVEGTGGKEAAFTIAIQMANVSVPANDDPANATVIPAETDVLFLTTPTEGALWDTVGPFIGDFITNADNQATIWYKLETGDRLGFIKLSDYSQSEVNGLPNISRIDVYKGSDIATVVGIGGVDVGQTSEISIEKNETYWIVVRNYYWSTSLSAKLTIQLQNDMVGGFSTDPGNGTLDFDVVTGGFVADAIDGEFVASGGVGYGSIQPWTADGHYPYGWWCRFDLGSTSGDYLYRYGQTQQYIEFFRATKAGGEYHSLFLVGQNNGTQEIWAGINGSVSFNTGYKVFGLNKVNTSEKVRIEIGENGITLDERCFRHSDFDFPIFMDTQDDQFDQFDFGIISYPGNGSAYVDLDPEWNLRFSNIRIHDNPDECVMGTPIEGVKEVVSIAGWTQGVDYYYPNSQSFRQLGTGPGGTNLATVVPSEGEYDGYSLDCSEALTSATKIKGYGWQATNTQPGTNLFYNPYLDPANDTYFPGLSFRFWIDTMPSADLVIAYIAGLDNGCYLILETDGTLSIKPAKASAPIPFCFTQVDKWNYIELQADVSSRKYATKIWLDDVYMGRFETTVVPTATNTGVPNRPPMWNSYAVGRLGSPVSPATTFSATTVGIQFRDVATTRRKIDRPLGPTIVIAKSIEADGNHNYPNPDTFEPNVPDEGFNSDFAGGTDGAGQPHYWTGYDRHDSSNSFPPPAGAMYLGYLFRTFANGLLSVVSDTSGPPGLTSALAMRVEAPSVIDPVNPGAGAAYVFGGASEPAVDLVFDLNYADTMSAQFWVKGPAGKTISIHAETGIGDYDGFNSHTCDGTWEHVKLWLTPQSVTTTVQLQAVVLDFANASVGDVFLIKDFHLYLNPENNPPEFWESSDGGATGQIVPFGATNTWSYLDDMPPDDITQIYVNARSFLNLVRGKEDDEKTNLPPLWSDAYLEWKFADYAEDNNQVFAAKMIVSLKGYNGQGNTVDDPPDLDTFVQGGYSSFTIASDDGSIRYAGKHTARVLSGDQDRAIYGIQLPRPPGNAEWNLTNWNETRLRLMSHDKVFINSLLIVGDFQGAGLIEGAVAEILTFDRRLTPPSCKQLIGVYTTVELT